MKTEENMSDYGFVLLSSLFFNVKIKDFFSYANFQMFTKFQTYTESKLTFLSYFENPCIIL